MSREGVVYGLVASDEPLQIRYVGQSVQPKERLYQHHNNVRASRFKGRQVSDWIRSVRDRGATLEMRVLGHYPEAELERAERRWIYFWSHYCQLENYFSPLECLMLDNDGRQWDSEPSLVVLTALAARLSESRVS